MTTELRLPEQATPATPAAGTASAYAKADGKFYSLDDAGVESLLSRRDSSCDLTNSGAATLTTGTWTALSFDTENFDTAALHTGGGPTRITIPAGLGGKWLVGGAVNFASNATGYRGVRFFLNGTAAVGSALYAAASGGATGIVHARLMALAAADYLELQAIQTSGGNLDTVASASSPFFWAVRVGD